VTYRQSLTFVHNKYLKTCTKVKQLTCMITGVPFLLLKKYIKIQVYGQQTKHL